MAGTAAVAAGTQAAAAKSPDLYRRHAVRENGTVSVAENANAVESVSGNAAGNASRNVIVRAAAIPGLNRASSRDRFPTAVDAMRNRSKHSLRARAVMRTRIS